MAAEGNAASASGRGCGLALGRLVRKLRRQSRMMLSTATSRPGAAAAARCQYDPLSYARNFDRSGLGDDDDVSAQLYHHYTFASRFVLAANARRQPQ
ncbi:hypothetical protein E2562_018263 [Oryza meyeriana var. granulata]|uniref:Uncharacterized protein n=1 Tax=Oryza meyeriana var. granulata TaxID=110450 RepID=A0A6G1CR68_9ORYZ|nr:hypothetical protein E2562_018263 [Oryza meyeriana var. granulata]